MKDPPCKYENKNLDSVINRYFNNNNDNIIDFNKLFKNKCIKKDFISESFRFDYDEFLDNKNYNDKSARIDNKLKMNNKIFKRKKIKLYQFIDLNNNLFIAKLFLQLKSISFLNCYSIGSDE